MRRCLVVTAQPFFQCCRYALMLLCCCHPALAADLPDTWNKQYIHDPEFQSQVLVIQTGMQHPKTVILVHGLGSIGLKDWMGVIRHLEKNYHVIALDLPGFGYSSPAKGRYTPTRYAQVIKNITERFQINRPIVVGHSLGGAVALRFAARYPDRLEKLVLVDVAGILERTAFLKHSTALPAPSTKQPQFIQQVVDAVDYLRNSLVEQTGFVPDPMQAIFQNDDAWQWLVSDSPNTNAALSLVSENYSRAVFETASPTTLIWGSEDKVAPLRTGKVLAKHLPDAQLYVIDGAGHVPMQSHLPQFISRLESALSGSEHAPNSIQNTTPFVQPLSDVQCTNNQNIHYRGHYRKITIQGCRNVTLSGVQAEKIQIAHSEVVLDDVQINSAGTAMETIKSVIVATNLDITATVGISASASRLDLAGLTINASREALVVNRKSRLVISTSRLASPAYRGYAHGAFVLKTGQYTRSISGPSFENQ